MITPIRRKTKTFHVNVVTNDLQHLTTSKGHDLIGDSSSNPHHIFVRDLKYHHITRDWLVFAGS